MTKTRLFQGLALVSISFIAAYLLLFKFDWQDVTPGGSATNSSQAILSYVPADTLFFYGGLEPASFQEALAVYTTGYNWLTNAEVANILSEDQLAQATPAEKMLAGLLSEYMLLLQDIPNAGKNLGVDDELDLAIYTVGAIPVLRLKLSDANAFNAFVKRAEQAVNVSPQQETLNGENSSITYSTYSFDASGRNDSTESKLIISVGDNYAVITFATPLEDANARHTMMGIKKPVNTLATSTLLQDLVGQYGFHPAYLGYVNHREIMNGITAADSNEFSRMLDTFLNIAERHQPETNDNGDTSQSDGASDSKPLEIIRKTECRNEFMAITALWPRTVFGYTEFNPKSTPKSFTARLIIESRDNAFMQNLKSLRGFIPSTLHQTTSKPIFALGVGLNVDALMPFLNQALQSFTQNTYECELLVNMQQQLASTNPAMAIGMMAGMAAGLQGVSVSVLDVDGTLDFNAENVMPDVNSIDALITISSHNPQGILMLVTNFMPDMPPLNIPADGTPIDLPIPLPLPNGESPKIAIKGKHLVAYLGKKAEKAANQLETDTLQSNGLLVFNMDLGEYMKLVVKGLEQKASASKSAQQELAMFKDMAEVNSQIVELFDVSDQGIVFETQMTLR